MSVAPFPIIAVVALVLLMGGVIKGTIGLGMPIFVLSVLGGFLDPRAVIALLLVPVVASNIWQGLGSGSPRRALARFWPLIVTFGIGTYAGTRLLASIPTQALLLLLGLVVLGFCATSWLKPQLRLASRLERWCGPSVGLVAGALNGVSMVNGPPLIMYLLALHLDRESLIGAYGLICLCGSVPLAASLIGLGVVRPPQLVGSVLALLPVFCGMWLGKCLRSRIDQELFRRMLLLVLALLGANLIRRGIG